MPRLILLRHGQSQWNLENRFTGWRDVDLSPEGRHEACTAGRLLRELGIAPGIAFTSSLKRAIRTLWIVLDELDLMWLPQVSDWRLNERHYGALEGLNKAQTMEEFGQFQVRIWRRSFDTPPPALAPDDPRLPAADPRYNGIDPRLLPRAESLKDTMTRLIPFWEESIRPALMKKGTLLISAHGNSIRSLIKHLDKVPDSEIPDLEIPTANPLVYELDEELTVLSRRYLDESRAETLP